MQETRVRWTEGNEDENRSFCIIKLFTSSHYVRLSCRMISHERRVGRRYQDSDPT